MWLDGQWLDAAWMVETVDGESGELVITATVAGPGAPRVAALRMDMGLARELRAGAGFVGGEMDGDGRDGRGAPCYDCRTTTQRVGDLETRMEQAEEELSILSGRIDNNGDALVHRLDALERAEGKGNLVWVDRVEQRLAELERAAGVQGQRTRLLERRVNALVDQVRALEKAASMLDDSTAAQVARLIERMEALETWQKRVEQTASMPLPGVGQMLDAYNAERDAAPVSYWDMKLLGMIERLSERVSLSFGGG
jgi:hypothetical protein